MRPWCALTPHPSRLPPPPPLAFALALALNPTSVEASPMRPPHRSHALTSPPALSLPPDLALALALARIFTDLDHNRSPNPK